MKSFEVVKKSKDLFKVALINLVLLFVFLEIGSLGFYWLKYKQFFYTRDLAKDSSELRKNLEGFRLNDSIVERFHPFFGFVQKPGPDFRPGFKVNNYGFISPYDYPFKKANKNQFIIGIFGGSVASNFSIFEIKNKIIANKLKKIPQLKNKEIIVLSFATGGYKQPQQLLILNYFLALGQELDLVINIDGFNEIALANLNNQNQMDITMPSIQHILPLTNLANNSLSPKALSALLRIQQTKSSLRDSLETLENCKLATCHVLTSLYIQNLLSNYRKDVMRFDREKGKKNGEGSIIYLNTNTSILKDAIAFEEMASLWAKSSIFMKKVLTPNNVLYFHFLQPNQYYKTNRVFSEEEKKIAFSNDTPYAKSVEIGYPVLFTKIKNLHKNNINFFDATKILDEIKKPVYVDNCCHYNDVGENFFANYVADTIVNSIKK